ncbi:helix-turn-helix transcriptional regulator [Pseudomonas sp. NPDC089996]|uniref:LexA family transcriptional regulator n=1 Tax=Pseudomonas sp. NPDC089996 TaxID=3364474 RepID=UPI0037FFF3FA
MNRSGDRFKALLKECGLTPSDFAAQRRVTSQHINNWFTRGIPIARLDEMAELFCVQRRWLQTGEGPKHPQSFLRMYAPQATQIDAFGASPEKPVPLVQVPFHELCNGQLVALDNQHLAMPASALEALDVPEDHAICMTMPASNMAPWIPRDALLAIDLSYTKVVDGEIYALLHNGRLRVNSLSLGHRGTLCLHSNNRHEIVERYTPLQSKAQKLEILGWVFHWSHYRQRRPD